MRGFEALLHRCLVKLLKIVFVGLNVCHIQDAIDFIEGQGLKLLSKSQHTFRTVNLVTVQLLVGVLKLGVNHLKGFSFLVWYVQGHGFHLQVPETKQKRKQL